MKLDPASLQIDHNIDFVIISIDKAYIFIIIKNGEKSFPSISLLLVLLCLFLQVLRKRQANWQAKLPVLRDIQGEDSEGYMERWLQWR